MIYKNKTSRGGRPNVDIVIMIKLLVLPRWFGLSDPELERQVADRTSFRIFLDTTEVVPDFSTVWLFRECLIKRGKSKELQRASSRTRFKSLIRAYMIFQLILLMARPNQQDLVRHQ
jgi:IS5 family transposase